MKKILVCLLVLGLVFPAGCKSVKEAAPTTEAGIQEPDIIPNIPLDFEAQYIRTNGGNSMEFPGVTVIDSKDALDDYYSSYKEVYNLERQFQLYSDTTMGFLDACDKYDVSFFEEKYLIFVTLEVGSGSVRHNVTSVEQNAQGKIEISIDSVLPGGIGTSDMAQWHIILELDHDYWISSPNMVMVYWNDRLAFDGVAIEPPSTQKVYTEPPKGTIMTQDGEASLRIGGHSWFYGDGAVTADQGTRPLQNLDSVTISDLCVETVYVFQEETGVYEPTNSLGYLVKLDWEVMPTTVKYTCWPDTVWENPDTEPEHVAVMEEYAFYAKPGGYVYEIVAAWDDPSPGYHGSANYYVYILGGVHTHMTALQPQTVDDPITGYCGNTQTTVHIAGEEFTFWGGHSVTLTDILINLDYDPMKVCRCRPEFAVDTEFGAGYGINLTAGYARCEKGQADLTVEQVKVIQKILDWLETTGGEYPTSER